jgi:RTX calcium-binding nonapeptide repeat (4 copies)
MRRPAFPLLLAALISTIALGASPASAATLRLNVGEAWKFFGDFPPSGVPDGPLARLSYRSAGDEVDRVAIDLEVVNGSALAYLVRAPADTSVGAGCSQANESGLWRCAIASGMSPIGPSIRLGGGNDSVSVPSALHLEAVLWGGSGNDRLDGGGRLSGGPGRDRVRAAGVRAVHVEGGSGPDHIVAGRGSDQIGGGDGADFIVPGRGKDTVFAGSGNDRIVAWKDGGDHVDCGAGTDLARVGGLDLVGPVPSLASSGDRCERVVRSTPARAVPEGVYEESLGLPTWIEVHCPWDLPVGCIAKATLSIRGGPTLGSRRLRIPAGDIGRARFYPSERTLALLEDRGARATVITYPPHRRPRKAVTVFPFSVYRGEG